MMKLLIIADDFTGAVDTGVQFSKKGIATYVTTNLNLTKELMEKPAEVLVVDTESRHVTKEESYDRVFQVTKKAMELGIYHFYKKTDSTLRGNIGSEMKAVLDAVDHGPVYFLPAFPKLKRITRAGMQYVDGIELKETSFGKDPFTPVCSSSIKEIILSQAECNVVITNKQQLKGELSAMHGNDVISIDGESEKDLHDIAETLKGNDISLLAGCAGFAEELPNLIPFKKSGKNAGIKAEKILMVCGSLSDVSRVQVKVAEKAGVFSIPLQKEHKLNDQYVQTTEGEAFIERTVQELEKHKTLILKSVLESDVGSVESGEEGLHIRIAANMGMLVNAILAKTKIDLLIVFGGDTIFGIVKGMNCSGIMPQTELLPGIVCSKLICENKEFTIVTKAGGFGDEDALVQIIHKCKRE